jgi:hypothetical protein
MKLLQEAFGELYMLAMWHLGNSKYGQCGIWAKLSFGQCSILTIWHLGKMSNTQNDVWAKWQMGKKVFGNNGIRAD